MEMGLKYFVLTELYVCNFVSRCFFWEESQLDMDELVDIDTLIVLESEDLVVPTPSVRQLFYAETARRDKLARSPKECGGKPALFQLRFFEGQPHAGLLVDADVT